MLPTCSILGGPIEDERVFDTADYEGAIARWCPGCGDHAVLTSMRGSSQT
jgi:pyruvate/2-oxoacid:ferredoxin oxidoreductase beta subunit